MSINLHHWNTVKDGPLSEEAMVAKFEAMGYSTNVYVYPKGTYFPDHTHAMDKIDGVLSGTFEIGIFGQKVTLKTGDYIEVPKKAEHNARVIGDECVRSVDAAKY